MAQFRIMVKGLWKGPFAEEALVNKFNAGGIPMGTQVQDVATNGQMAIEDLAAGSTLILDQPVRAAEPVKKLSNAERNAPTQKISKPLKPPPAGPQARLQSAARPAAPAMPFGSGNTALPPGAATRTGTTKSGATSTGTTKSGATSTGATKSGTTKSGATSISARTRAPSDSHEDSGPGPGTRSVHIPKKARRPIVVPERKSRGVNWICVLGCLALLGGFGAPWFLFEGAAADGGDLMLFGFDLPYVLTVDTGRLGQAPPTELFIAVNLLYALYLVPLVGLLTLLGEFVGAMKGRNRWWMRLFAAFLPAGIVAGGAYLLFSGLQSGVGADVLPAAASYEAFLQAAFEKLQGNIQPGLYAFAAAPVLILLSVVTSPRRKAPAVPPPPPPKSRDEDEDEE